MFLVSVSIKREMTTRLWVSSIWEETHSLPLRAFKFATLTLSSCHPISNNPMLQVRKLRFKVMTGRPAQVSVTPALQTHRILHSPLSYLVSYPSPLSESSDC